MNNKQSEDGASSETACSTSSPISPHHPVTISQRARRRQLAVEQAPPSLSDPHPPTPDSLTRSSSIANPKSELTHASWASPSEAPRSVQPIIPSRTSSIPASISRPPTASSSYIPAEASTSRLPSPKRRTHPSLKRTASPTSPKHKAMSPTVHFSSSESEREDGRRDSKPRSKSSGQSRRSSKRVSGVARSPKVDRSDGMWATSRRGSLDHESSGSLIFPPPRRNGVTKGHIASVEIFDADDSPPTRQSTVYVGRDVFISPTGDPVHLEEQDQYPATSIAESVARYKSAKALEAQSDYRNEPYAMTDAQRATWRNSLSKDIFPYQRPSPSPRLSRFSPSEGFTSPRFTSGRSPELLSSPEDHGTPPLSQDGGSPRQSGSSSSTSPFPSFSSTSKPRSASPFTAPRYSDKVFASQRRHELAAQSLPSPPPSPPNFDTSAPSAARHNLYIPQTEDLTPSSSIATFASKVSLPSHEISEVGADGLLRARSLPRKISKAPWEEVFHDDGLDELDLMMKAEALREDRAELAAEDRRRRSVLALEEQSGHASDQAIGVFPTRRLSGRRDASDSVVKSTARRDVFASPSHLAPPRLAGNLPQSSPDVDDQTDRRDSMALSVRSDSSEYYDARTDSAHPSSSSSEDEEGDMPPQIGIFQQETSAWAIDALAMGERRMSAIGEEEDNETEELRDPEELAAATQQNGFFEADIIPRHKNFKALTISSSPVRQESTHPSTPPSPPSPLTPTTPHVSPPGGIYSHSNTSTASGTTATSRASSRGKLSSRLNNLFRKDKTPPPVPVGISPETLGLREIWRNEEQQQQQAAVLPFPPLSSSSHGRRSEDRARRPGTPSAFSEEYDQSGSPFLSSSTSDEFPVPWPSKAMQQQQQHRRNGSGSAQSNDGSVTKPTTPEVKKLAGSLEQFVKEEKERLRAIAAARKVAEAVSSHHDHE